MCLLFVFWTRKNVSVGKAGIDDRYEKVYLQREIWCFDRWNALNAPITCFSGEGWDRWSLRESVSITWNMVFWSVKCTKRTDNISESTAVGVTDTLRLSGPLSAAVVARRRGLTDCGSNMNVQLIRAVLAADCQIGLEESRAKSGDI